VGYKTLSEEGVHSALGPINELVRYDKIQRMDCLLKASNGTDRDDVFDAHGFEGVDVGSCGQFRRADAMPLAVSGEKGYPHVLQSTYGDNVAGLTKGSGQFDLFDIA
jgi:hypothetical protein